MHRYRGEKSSGWAAAVVVALSVTLMSTARVAALAVPVVEDAWDTFTANVSIKQVLVNSKGAVLQASPSVEMRMERAKSATGWRTNVTLQRVDTITVQSTGGVAQLDNPFLVVRMEYDGDGTAARFFNRRGERVTPPGKTDLGLLAVPAGSTTNMAVADLSNPAIVRTTFSSPNPDWTENVVATPSKRVARRNAIERQYGPKRGKVNGLDQYVTTVGNMTCEALVNGDAVVPVEVNVAQGGTLTARSTFAYELRPDGVWVRRALHSERATTIGTGNRTVLDVALTNVALTRAVAK